MSPMLRSVKEAGLKALETRAAPWNILASDWFTNAEILRSLAAGLFQTDSNNVALIPSASYGLAAAAKNLSPGQGKEIVILEEQFPSNYYVWENLAARQNLKLIIVQKNNDKSLTENILDKINYNTGIVAIPNCHWIDGHWIDLEQISDAVKAVGAHLVLDLSQSLGVLPIDMERIQPDFAISVGYKWQLGPYSLGYMYVSKKWQELGEPLEYPWITKKGSEDFSRLTNYVTAYREGARKFDMGEFAQFNLLPMAIAALQQLTEWKTEYIQTEIIKLTTPILDYKKKLNGSDKSPNVGHIVSIPLLELNVDDLKKRLKSNNVIISFRGSSIRVSPHLYNSPEDIDRLLSCLNG
ncbi:MAG TPA: aminotransferase class V-fold PLP-dependent enzyme [Chitinophagaceae bacterium]|nr:aminotransferase class V-fold PLP-dependent enzyme [Chitinophagaceae bacterium]